jgi:N-acetyl-1-D-myo-inositol-2-amino-2-deoxy-alpha-D-glucopyranoside deacetylase
MTHSLLAVFAHPDDEAFGTGGTLARYAAGGAEVTLVCATRGEAGEIADESLATPATLGHVRENELRCAAETMGIREVVFLDYRDSGMVGTAENQHPDALINAPAAVVVTQLAGIIRRIRPEVVVTFEPNGGYGHPDHIAIHRHTVNAFHAAGNAGQYPELGTPHTPRRLYYTAIPRSFFRRMISEMQALGLDTTEFQHFADGGGGGWPDEQVTAVIDVSATVDAKWQALHCHRTQFGPGNLFRRLPESTVREMMSREHFAQAWPERAGDTGIVGDLFAGL